MPDPENRHLDPLVTALYGQLASSVRRESAVAALMRLRESLGRETFDRLSHSCVSPRDRQMFHTATSALDHQGGAFHSSGKKPPDGVSFGSVPNVIVNRLLEKASPAHKTK